MEKRGSWYRTNVFSVIAANNAETAPKSMPRRQLVSSFTPDHGLNNEFSESNGESF